MSKDTNDIRDEIKKQQEKLKDMDKKQKLSYYIYYYKYHFIIMTVVLILVISTVVSMATAPETLLSVMMINTADGFVEGTELKTDFANIIGAKEDNILFDTSVYLSSDKEPTGSGAEYAAVAKVITAFSSGDTDLFICDNSTLESYCSDSLFCDLRLILDDETYEKAFNDNLLYIAMDAYGDALPVGIKLKDNEKLVSTGFYMAGDEVYAAISANSERTETAARFIKYLINE